MTFEEIKQYNKLVIDTANDIAKGWKWATFILGGLLLAMIILYFTCPAEVEVKQKFDGSNSIGTTNYQKG